MIEQERTEGTEKMNILPRAREFGPSTRPFLRFRLSTISLPNAP